MEINNNLEKDHRNLKSKEIKIDSAILLLERTHHDNSLLEVISPLCIKQTANLKNGDIITIELKDLNQIS